MDKYNRVNLVFQKALERDNKALRILNSHRNKTQYVINAILFYEENRLEINRKLFKELIQDAIKDLGYSEKVVDKGGVDVVNAADITLDLLESLDF